MTSGGAVNCTAGIYGQANGNQGFTLVEVMVALTLLSLVMMATLSGLRTLGNTQSTLERTTNRVDGIRSVSSFLRDLLESAVAGENPGQFSLGGGSQESTYFAWSDNFLELESILIFGEGFGGSYFVRVGQEGSKLVLRWQERPANGKPEDWMDMPSRVMIENLEEFSLATRTRYGEAWSDRSENEWRPMPKMVRFQIKADGRDWPVLIVRIQP